MNTLRFYDILIHHLDQLRHLLFELRRRAAWGIYLGAAT